MTHIHKPVFRFIAPFIRRHGMKAALIGGASALAIGLVGSPGVALAQDAPCLDRYSILVAPPPATDQGQENAGGNNTTCAGYASAFGILNNAGTDYSSAFGFGNRALGERSNAFGLATTARGDRSAVFGVYAETAAEATGALALGTWFDVNNDQVIDWSEHTYAAAVGSAAVGVGVHTYGFRSSAFGVNLQARGAYSSAFGFGSTTAASATGALAIGGWADANTNGVIDPGELTTATAMGAVAVGTGTAAHGDFSAAFGVGAVVELGAHRGTAIGVNTRVTAEEATAIGYGAVADRARTVSVGSAGAERNIIHVADAVQGTDAVNLRQMIHANNFMGTTLSQILGGGMTYNSTLNSTSVLFPQYSIQNASYTSVGGAFAAIDQRLTGLAADIAAITVTPGPQGPAGPVGPQGPQGPGNPLSPGYDDASRDTLTLEGANGTRVANVADGVAATDAVNVRQMEAGDAATLTSARTYADAGDAATLTAARTYADVGDARTLSSAMAYTDQKLAVFDDRLTGVSERLDGQERRIDRLGAMSSAQLNMAMNAAGSLPGRGRLAVGLGFQNGEEALSVGYGRRLANGVSISVGGAFGRGGEQSGGVGIGFDIF